jgi:hypothetical protein
LETIEITVLDFYDEFAERCGSVMQNSEALGRAAAPEAAADAFA